MGLPDLVDAAGRPTARGRLVSFFHGGDGLAVAVLRLGQRLGGEHVVLGHGVLGVARIPDLAHVEARQQLAQPLDGFAVDVGEHA